LGDDCEFRRFSTLRFYIRRTPGSSMKRHRRVETRDKSVDNRSMMKPTVYLILFRGVGGKTQLPTKPLRKKLAAAGFENVATYINSGNAIVRSQLKREKVIATIAELCRKHFAFDKAIFAPTLAEWDAVIARNPFVEAAATAPITVHAALLDGTPKPEDIARIRAFAVKAEDIDVIEGVAYIHTIGVQYTARNWNTVLKLVELGRAAEQ
jgi:uncharacterized protein (DUF1697 family)